MSIIRSDSGTSLDAAGLGPCVALVLADSDDATRWRLTIDAILPLGHARVGVLDSAAVSPGSGRARLIGIAFFPGATSWRVSWTHLAGPANKSANLELLATRDYCGPIGVVPNGSFSTVLP